jgi:hypothetical protein
MVGKMMSALPEESGNRSATGTQLTHEKHHDDQHNFNNIELRPKHNIY